VFRKKYKVQYIPFPTLYPMGPLTFAIACSHCKNLGTERCGPCKEERASGFELKTKEEKEG